MSSRLILIDKLLASVPSVYCHSSSVSIVGQYFTLTWHRVSSFSLLFQSNPWICYRALLSAKNRGCGFSLRNMTKRFVINHLWMSIDELAHYSCNRCRHPSLWGSLPGLNSALLKASSIIAAASSYLVAAGHKLRKIYNSTTIESQQETHQCCSPLLRDYGTPDFSEDFWLKPCAVLYIALLSSPHSTKDATQHKCGWHLWGRSIGYKGSQDFR